MTLTYKNMPPKITINGKELDVANLPPEFQKMVAMSPELKEMFADKDGNGVPDIADNPFAMLGKLGQLSSMAKDMPVLLSSVKGNAKKPSPDSGYLLPSSSTSQQSGAGSLKQNPRPSSKSSMQQWASASPPIKHDTGRRVLFILAAVGLIGWYIWQGMPK